MKLASKAISPFRKKLFKNVNGTNYEKNCLLVYMTAPFRRGNMTFLHQTLWQCTEIARLLGEFGYNVDVIDFHRDVRLAKAYDLIIDIHPGLNKSYQNHMTENCKKIVYCTGANVTFSNAAEQKRLDDLFMRKGVRLRARRYFQPIERREMLSFDGVLLIGNSYTWRTYNEFGISSVSYIKNTGYDFPGQKDFSKKSSSKFLYMGSAGQVFRGLDLLLDIFSERPDLTLYVCAQLKAESDFCALYKKELFNTANIIPVGFVDIRSKNFAQIAAACSYMILPSAAEGMSGSVLVAMSAGIIPIVSRECGLEDDEVQHLPDCNLQTIARVVDEYSKKPLSWIEIESRRVMDIARTRYNNRNFTDCMRSALRRVL